MTPSSPILDVSQDTFEAEVLQMSLTTPVLVDFWAPWCGPCKALGPLLEKLAVEYNGAFRLARIDVDKEQAIAGMFGVRSIPTVMLVKNGEIADGFAGALPEGQLREFLARHVQPAEAMAEDTAADEADDDATETPQQALARLQQALADAPDDDSLKLDLALALMRNGDTAAARTQLDALPANLATDDRAVRLRGQLELAQALEGAPGVDELQQRISVNASDWSARDLLGVSLVLGNDPAGGLEQFLAILKDARDWNDGLAKKRLVAAFQVLDDAALVGQYRRRMASLLF